MAGEYLTESQQELATLIRQTQTTAKVRGRVVGEDGRFQLFQTELTQPLFGITPHPEVFYAIRAHDANPKRALSPHYLNLRGLSTDLIGAMGRALADIELPYQPDFCEGIPDAATLIAEAYFEHTQIPVLGALEKVNIGTNRDLVIAENTGYHKRDRSIAILDDTFSDGGTKRLASERLRSIGLKRQLLLVVFDREEGNAREELEKSGLPVFSALRLRPTLRFWLETKQIDEYKYHLVTNYLNGK